MTVSQQALSIRKNGREILRTPLPETQALIGRSPVCDVVLRAPHLTAIHFLLEKQDFEVNEGTASSLWMLFDISSGKLKAVEDQEKIRSAEGVVLGEEDVTIGGFQFAIVTDNLASTSLEKDAFIRNVRESSEKQNENLQHQGAFLNAIECLLYDRESNSIVALRHFPLRANGKVVRPFFSLPNLGIRMPNKEDEPVTLQTGKDLAFLLRNHGATIERSSHTPTILITKKDFLELQTARFEVYFRYVHYDQPTIPKDPRLKWQAAILSLMLAAFAMVSLGVFKLPEKPLLRERVVTLKTKPTIEIPKPPVHPVAAPVPLPVAKPAPPSPVAAPPVPAPIHAPAPAPAPVVAAKPKPVKEPRKTHEPKVATPTPADSDWKSAMSQLKKYSADKRNQVKASSILDASEKMSDPSPSGVSAVSPRRLEDSQDSLKVLGNRAAPTLSMDSTTPKNPQESLARVDVGNIRATVDLESSSTESTISGGLSKSQVQDLIRQNRNQIRNCYQKQLALKPKLQGRILYSWTILADGRVQDVEIKSFTLSSKEVRTCIQQVLRNLHYPASTNQMVTQVLYPFYLAPY